MNIFILRHVFNNYRESKYHRLLICSSKRFFIPRRTRVARHVAASNLTVQIRSNAAFALGSLCVHGGPGLVSAYPRVLTTLYQNCLQPASKEMVSITARH